MKKIFTPTPKNPACKGGNEWYKTAKHNSKSYRCKSVVWGFTPISLFVIILFSSFGFSAYAACDTDFIPNPLGVCTFSDLAYRIAELSAALGSAVAVVVLIYGAWQYVTSGGNPEQLKAAKDTIFWAAVGLGLLILAGGIIAYIQTFLETA